MDRLGGEGMGREALGRQRQVPLMSAILHAKLENCADMASYSLSRWGLAVNAQDRYGKTALHLVVRVDLFDFGLCKMLLRSPLDCHSGCSRLKSVALGAAMLPYVSTAPSKPLMSAHEDSLHIAQVSHA